MAMRRIQNKRIRTNLQQLLGALQHVVRDPNRGGTKQPSLRVLGGIRILHGFLDVLNGNQSLEISVVVYQRQLFNLMCHQDFFCFIERGSHPAGNKVVLRHHFFNFGIIRAEKANVTVGKNADQFSGIIRNRHAADAVLGHNLHRIVHIMILGEKNRIVDNAVFAALHTLNLIGLIADGHIFMNNADAALARDGDRHTRLGDGIHRRRNERNVQTDRSRKICRQVDVRRQHRAFRRYEEHIVVRKSFLTELFFKIHTHSKPCPFLFRARQTPVFLCTAKRFF